MSRDRCIKCGIPLNPGEQEVGLICDECFEAYEESDEESDECDECPKDEED